MDLGLRWGGFSSCGRCQQISENEGGLRVGCMSSKLTKGGLLFVEGGLKVGCFFHARRQRWVDLFSRPIKGGLGFRVIGTNLHERYRTISVARPRSLVIGPNAVRLVIGPCPVGRSLLSDVTAFAIIGRTATTSYRALVLVFALSVSPCYRTSPYSDVYYL